MTLDGLALWIFLAGLLTGLWLAIVATVMVPEAIWIWRYFFRHPGSIRRDRILGRLAAKLFKPRQRNGHWPY